jgi:Ni,Fe-hydrogenase III small subunit
METEENDGASHIYVIDMSGQAFKIGVAKEPRKRLSEIQVASPFRMTLAGCVELPARHAHSVEKSLHKRYEDHWLRHQGSAAKEE